MNYIVYKHTSPSGKCYIGISHSTMQERKNNGYGHNKEFTNEIKKYGWNNFKHEILKDNLTQEEAFEQEQIFIELFRSNNAEFGFNKSQGGKSTFGGLKHTNEAKLKISKSNTGKTFSEEHRQNLKKANTNNPKLCGKNNHNFGRAKTEAEIQKQYESHKHQMKPIIRLDLNGAVLEEFESIHLAQRKLKISKAAISACLKGKSKTCLNSYWIYKKEGGLR